ncbi:MAG: hypothetical protein GX219_06605 [Tissierellia bacterium]|nr:hypothetical protein [Tissierellia bacterium]
MKIKCEYCKSMINDYLEDCPYCGAPNKNVNRTSKEIPESIEELVVYCNSHNIPIDKFRFFIGEDYRGPKAYGIYKDGQRTIVYKNKANGQRAIRYDGTDEKYAVNEIYQKLQQEMNSYKAFRANKGQGIKNNNKSKQTGKNGRKIFKKLFIICVIFLGVIYFILNTPLKDGVHYSYDGINYYFDTFYWFIYEKETDNYKKIKDSEVPQHLIQQAAKDIPEKGGKHYIFNDEEYYYDDSYWYIYDIDDDSYTYIDDYDLPSDLIENPEDYYSYTEEYIDSSSSSYDDDSWDSDDDWGSDWDDSDWDYDYDSDWDSDW